MKIFKIFVVILLVFSVPMCSYSQQNICDTTLAKKRSDVVYYKQPPHFYYSHLPAIDEIVNKLPYGAILVTPGSNIFYYDGIYYQVLNEIFKVILAPKGTQIYLLPYGAKKIKIDNKLYYYYFGTFYTISIDGSFIVVNAPIGAKVNALPCGYKTLKKDNKYYYIFDHTLYEEILTEDNEIIYLVLKHNIQ